LHNLAETSLSVESMKSTLKTWLFCRTDGCIRDEDTNFRAKSQTLQTFVRESKWVGHGVVTIININNAATTSSHFYGGGKESWWLHNEPLGRKATGTSFVNFYQSDRKLQPP
jgi:hypothetical protein